MFLPFTAALAALVPQAALAESDSVIRQKLIRESIDSYPGNCPCPYNVDRAGRSCGLRSAYSRPGGFSPLCYPKDVSKVDIEAYRQRNR